MEKSLSHCLPSSQHLSKAKALNLDSGAKQKLEHFKTYEYAMWLKAQTQGAAAQHPRVATTAPTSCGNLAHSSAHKETVVQRIQLLALRQLIGSGHRGK
jgi:hypothetical protein